MERLHVRSAGLKGRFLSEFLDYALLGSSAQPLPRMRICLHGVWRRCQKNTFQEATPVRKGNERRRRAIHKLCRRRKRQILSKKNSSYFPLLCVALSPSPNPVSMVLPSDHLFKIVIVGDSGTGKSCLLLRFTVCALSHSSRLGLLLV